MLTFLIEIESKNGWWWLQGVGLISKGLASVKFCDSFLHVVVSQLSEQVDITISKNQALQILYLV